MKYAFMSFSCPRSTLGRMLALARRFGYDGIEPRIDAGHRHGVELETTAVEREAIRQQALESGIAICCIATSCRYADPATTREQIEVTHRCIDLAADVGAARLRVFGGEIPEGVSREAAVDLVARSLRAVADHAAERGVIVCLETHDDWCHPLHVAEVMKRVNHPYIAVNWDVIHPVRRAGFTVDQAFQALRPWIRHVHFHDGSAGSGRLEYLPLGEGIVDHRRVISLLHEMGYEGYLSGEWINWEPCEVHLPRELATMKRFEREVTR